MIRGPELTPLPPVGVGGVGEGWCHLNASADPMGLSVKYIHVRIRKKRNETIFQYAC